jgi:hypothetical protein
MGALSFLQAGFVAAGVAAAALPILIHLLMRQRARPMPIGSIRFLQSVIREHTRRRRVRQWLLLALRVLALVLLGALFARPYFDRTAEIGRNQEVIVLVDRSASMQAPAQSGGAIFERAIDAAEKEIASAAPNTKVRVALFDSQVDEQPLDAWDKAKAASAAGTNYSSALAWARDKVAASARASRRVVIVTDLQEAGVKSGAVKGFPRDAPVTIHDVGRAMSRNLAIEDIRATFVEIRPKNPVTVAVRVRNTGVLPVKDASLSLRLDGPQFGAIGEDRKLSLAGGETATLDFALDVDTPGLHQGSASLDYDDDLAFDNRRYVAFDVRRPDRVLLVDGEQGASAYSSETYYLDTALRLSSSALEGPPRTHQVERIVWADGDGFPDLTGFRACILANVGRLSSVDVERLKKYVFDGGGALIFSGDQTSRPAVLLALRESKLIPARIPATPLEGTWRITSFDKSHPAMLPFSDPQHGDLRRLTFRRISEVRDLSSPAKVLASAGDKPLVIENSVGKGRILFVATAADRQWSDWPQSRLYVPMVRQMTAYLCGWLDEHERVREVLANRPGDKPGIERKGDITTVRNVDPRESDLKRISEASFRKRLGLPDEESKLSRAAAAIPAPPGAERPDESWRIVAWILLALLAGEMLFSSRVHA